MNRFISSALPLAALALSATSHSQTYVQRNAAGTSYSGVSANERLVQLSDDAGNSSVYGPGGVLDHNNAGFNGARGVSDVGREYLGFKDPSYPLEINLGFLRQGNDAYATSFESGGNTYRGLLTGVPIDPVSGKLAFGGFDTDSQTFGWAVDGADGPAVPVVSDGVIGTAGLTVESISASGSVAGVGLNLDATAHSFYMDAAGFHELTLPGGLVASNLMLNSDATGDRWITGTVSESGQYWGTAWSLENGAATWTGLHLDGAYGTSSAWGGKAAFWSGAAAYDVDLATLGIHEIKDTQGQSLADVTSVFSRASGYYVNRFENGSGTVRAVPEPATFAGLGLGLAALSRRRRK